uniref:DUF3444 domain-containing protein n=1 Tax=Nicotiana tabacum TaxID=4097 RepID=A0A1S3YA22_TOBAC|nr:PREDICTED: uncharacterized protein LOC107774107 [Nicotiana tabacum]
MEDFPQKINKTYTGFYPNLGSHSAQADRVKKKRHINEQKATSKRRATMNQLVGKARSGSHGIVHGNENGVLRAERVVVVGSNKPQSSRELSQSEVRNMLVEKARTEICKKLNEWSTTSASRMSYKEDKETEKKQTAAAHTAQGFHKNDLRREETVNGVLVNSSKSCKHKESSVVSTTSVDSEPEDTEIKSMRVPDSDFRNFDEDRTEKLFEDNQVWAAYDNDDGMPHYYALIHNVISRKPFKVRISW